MFENEGVRENGGKLFPPVAGISVQEPNDASQLLRWRFRSWAGLLPVESDFIWHIHGPLHRFSPSLTYLFSSTAPLLPSLHLHISPRLTLEGTGINLFLHILPSEAMRMHRNTRTYTLGPAGLLPGVQLAPTKCYRSPRFHRLTVCRWRRQSDM